MDDDLASAFRNRRSEQLGIAGIARKARMRLRKRRGWR